MSDAGLWTRWCSGAVVSFGAIKYCFVSITCEVGQMLLAGEPVGQMPEDGDAKLYMEIRKDNQPLDPLAWVKV